MKLTPFAPKFLLRQVLIFILILSAVIPVALVQPATTVYADKAGVCATPGADGSPVISGIVNSYFPGSANAVIGATSITLGTLDARGSATTINAGDLLLVIQMQGADIDTNNDARYGAGVGTPGDKFSPGSGDVNANFSAGQYEYVVAQNAVGAGGGTLNLTTGLVNNYFNANYATQGQRRFQVVRVPQYVSATLGGTLTAPAWNGATGGTVIVDVAGGLNLNGNTIDVTGLGFRGGAGIQMGGDNTAPIPNQLDFYSVAPAAIPNQTNSAGGATPAAAADTTNGAKGEGTAGTPRYVNVITAGIPSLANTGVEGYPSGSMGRGAPGNAGGGGTDGDPAANGFNSGGGGGGNGGAGGNGGKSYSQQVADGGWGGSVLGSAGTSAVAPSRLVLGGGGGAGSNNNGTYAYYNGTTVQNNPSAGAAAVALIGFQPALLSSGQPGGGIIMVRAGVVTGNGTINAKGRSGYRVTTSPGANANYEVNYDGGGGGGAGGSVVVVAQNASTPGLTVNAQGGDGGNTNHQGAGAPPPHGPGGGGGGGVVYTSFAIANPANAVNGGLNGLTRNTTPWDTAFNAFPGAAGVLSQSQSPASFPGSISGAGCLTPATLTKSFNPISIGLNGASTATFTITNTVGNPSQTGLAFTETLPANLTLAAVPVSPQCGGTVTGVVGGVAIGFTGGSLPAGTASCSITASVTGNVGGTYNNSPGNISNASTNLDTSSVNATLTVAAPSLTKTFTPTSIPTGGTSTLTFTITNGAGDPAQTGMQFTETLPLNVTLSAAPVSPQCGGTVTGVAGGTTIGFSSGILAAGVNTCTITATVTSATAATYNNLPANVTGSNLNTSGINASLTVTARAVTVTKAFNPTRIGVGQTSILTFTLSNLTAAAQNNNIQFTDTLPAGLTAAVTTPQCGAVVTVTNVAGTARAINFGNGVTNGSLAANATCTFTVTVTGVTAGTYNNTTALLSNVSANLEGSGITASLTVVGTTLTKSFSPASIGVGGTSTLTFTITNGAGLPAQAGLRFLETLPAGLTLSAVPVTPQCGGNVVGAVGGNTIQLGSVTGGSLALGEASCTISATVTGTGISTYLNTTANVTGVSTNITNNANASLTIAGTGLTKSFVPSTIPTGGTSTLTFTISNNGTGYPAQTGLRFTETLPANVTLSAVPVTPQCGGNVTGVVGGNTIQFGNVTGGSLSAGTASCTITATVTSATAGTYTNIAANISNLSNNVNATGIIATLTVLSPACASGQFSRWDFQNVITPSVGSGAFTAVNLTGPAYVLGATGQAVSYSNWPLAVATTDYVDFAVPTNGRGNITMTFDESRSAQGPTTFVVYYSTDGATYTQLGAAYTSATTWTNRVIDFSGVAGLNNNPNAHFRLYAYSANVVAGAWRLDNVTFTGNCIADLSVTKTDGVTTYTPGTSTTYTIVVANSGPTNITNATFTDTFPAAITAANWTCIGAGGATCPAASGSGNINATVTIPFGGSLTYTVTAAINSAATGNLINTATIAAPAGTLDPTAGNNSSTDTNTMLPIADLAVTKSDGVTSVKAGGTTTYTLTLTNNGPSAANSTTLRDAAAAGLTKIAIGACTVAGGAVCPTAGVGAGQMNIANLENGTVVVPTLPNGGSISFSVTVNVNAASGSVANIFTATPPVGTTDPTPATATDTNNVIEIIAADDTGSTVNGTTGGQSVANVLSNDSLNGTSPVLLADVNLTQVATTNAGVTLNPADGSVNVAAGTPVGNYTVTYQICDKLNPTICDTATVGVSVGTIISVDDIGSTVNGTTGGQSLLNVLANDSLNGTSPVLLADVNLTQVSTTNAGVTLNPVDGSVNVAAGTAAGSYTVTYQICDILNPTICDTATVSVPVGTIIAVDDMGSTVNGTIGGQTLVNVLANDSLNGTSPVLLADVNLTQVSTTNAGVTLNPADGSVNVAAGTAAGSYTVTYQFCDKLNPTICDTATVGVPVSVDYADLALTKTVDNPSPNVGDNIIFIVTATNSGPSHATGVIVNDLLPAGLTYVSDNGGGTYVSATGNWTIGNLNSGASISLQITATVIQVGGITNTAQVISSDQLDPNSTNNQASASIGGIFDPPSAIKTINAAGLPELEFRMVWINSGNTLAIDVQVTDQIPTGTTYVAGSLTCVLLGSSLNAAAASSPLSVTAVPSSFCGYDSVANRIQWQGSMGPDNGNTTEAGAANEVVITFRVTVDGAVNQVQNQGFSRTDVDSDGNFDEETVLGASLVGSNVVVWNRSPSGPGNPGNGANLPRALPATGFAPNVVTTLPKQSAEKAYAATDVWLELPSLGVKVPIVGVPLVDNKWDLSWLGSQAGWLDGTAFPSWQGNSALTGHVTLSNGKSGPFANLGSLKWGDKIIVHAYGSAYTYEVRENKTIAPNDTSVLKHEDNAWLTLITCKTYSETKNTYANRISVRAVLLSVAEEGGGSRSARGR